MEITVNVRELGLYARIIDRDSADVGDHLYGKLYRYELTQDAQTVIASGAANDLNGILDLIGDEVTQRTGQKLSWWESIREWLGLP